MTITRVATLGADDRNLGRVDAWGGSATKPSISSTKANTGTYSYRCSWNPGIPFGKHLNAVPALRMSAAINHLGAAGFTTDILTVMSLKFGNTGLVVQYYPYGNQLYFTAGFSAGTNNYRSPVSAIPPGELATTNAWISVALTAYIHDTNGFVSFYVNGNQMLNWTGDTRIYQSMSNTPISTISGAYVLGHALLGGYPNWAQFVYADDICIDTLSGNDIVDACPPNYRLLWYAVNGAGHKAQWTPSTGLNHECVDESPADGSTSYIYSATNGQEDSYAITEPAIPARHNVHAFTTLHVGQRLDATSPATLVPTISKEIEPENWVTADGTPRTLATAWQEVETHFTTNPNGDHWANADMTDLQIGQKTLTVG